eukprot:CAMPEP_0118692124 /NCGR_PEP_ID=MMETSP0800-20121206/11083_1 /TAXON_ID=210618 ORGANISM="Striatella unipunctata, Strain CCMP2910" /NCGR_SAMPLE_ID=MMETSP0800 /ASSEMBLY_ACC=CAM_ASM_000638 /LENGTH=208 /DNA_ID=CAMNT_0006590023 /DNA_START=125 /DNA_END=751 /DNA_ORIENTATION=+
MSALSWVIIEPSHFITIIALMGTMLLGLYTAFQGRSYEHPDLLKAKNKRYAFEKETFDRALMHLRSRLVAQKATMERKKKTVRALQELIIESDRHIDYSVDQALQLARRAKAAVLKAKLRCQQEVLWIFTKAIMVSNRPQKQPVLNSIGMDWIMTKMEKLPHVRFFADKFKRLVKQQPPQQAVKAIYFHIMDDSLPKSDRFFWYPHEY